MIPEIELQRHPETGELIPEIWKRLPEDNAYSISNYGRVTSSVRGNERLLKTYPKNEYPVFSIQRKGGRRKEFYIHRVIARLFLANTPDLEVNHKDLDRTNNFIGNLEWVTHSQNTQHAYDNGRCNRSHLIGQVPHNAKKVVAIRELCILEFNSGKEASKQLGIDHRTISKYISQGRTFQGYSLYSI